MSIHIETTHSSELSIPTLQQICTIAAHGFEQPDDAAMRADTMRHVHGSSAVQLAYIDEELAAFSLYGSSLWRPSY